MLDSSRSSNSSNPPLVRVQTGRRSTNQEAYWSCQITSSWDAAGRKRKGNLGTRKLYTTTMRGGRLGGYRGTQRGIGANNQPTITHNRNRKLIYNKKGRRLNRTQCRQDRLLQSPETWEEQAQRPLQYAVRRELGNHRSSWTCNANCWFIVVLCCVVLRVGWGGV